MAWKKKPRVCHYPIKGIGLVSREVHKEVCGFHRERKDKYCYGCRHGIKDETLFPTAKTRKKGAR